MEFKKFARTVIMSAALCSIFGQTIYAKTIETDLNKHKQEVSDIIVIDPGDGGSGPKIEFRPEYTEEYQKFISDNNESYVEGPLETYSTKVTASTKTEAEAALRGKTDVYVVEIEGSVSAGVSGAITREWNVYYKAVSYTEIEIYDLYHLVRDLYMVGYLKGTSTKSGDREYIRTEVVNDDVRVKTGSRVKE